MTVDSWATDPLNSNNACASLNIVAFNASVSSYDHDETSSSILGGNSPQALTNVIGDPTIEGIDGNRFFLGRNVAETDEFCGLKTISALGDSYGLCPEGPTVDGSFHMAGMAALLAYMISAAIWTACRTSRRSPLR